MQIAAAQKFKAEREIDIEEFVAVVRRMLISVDMDERQIIEITKKCLETLMGEVIRCLPLQ